ncbi:MAG TPA: S41 family peptidase [Pyrinomonadaceae bacterium]|nr:S41 family peptidase [Pyrinomonadaceae bacterium]
MAKVRQLFLLAVLILALGLSQSTLAQKRKRQTGSTVRGTAIQQVLQAPAVASMASQDVQRRIDTFEKVWTTIHKSYFDPTFNNLNWTQIYQEFSPKARAAKSDRELHKLLNEMIARLQRSHLAIIPPEIYEAIETARTDAKQRERDRLARRADRLAEPEKDEEELDAFEIDDPLSEYGPGVELRLLDNKFVITRLQKDSAAGYAGLKTGYIIESINDVSMGMLLARVQVYSPVTKNLRRYLPHEIIDHFLNGEKDTHVKIGYRDEKDELKEVTVRRERIRSETVSISPNYPDTQLQFETVSLNDDVGLVRFDRFALRVVERFCDALGEFKTKKALIIDLRGNMGGTIGAVVALAGMLTESRIDLGTSIYRSGPEPLTARSKPRNFKGRIVVLVDDMSVSAAEMFSASLQDGKRAIIVGDRTAGETLPAIAVDLPTGARLMYPIANYKSASGKLLEGDGVAPDRLVPLDRKSLLDGRDPQLEAGLQTLKDDAAFAKLGSAPTDFTGPRFIVSGSAPPPPPPPMKAKPNVGGLPNLATVTIQAPPEPKERAPVRDPKAVKVIADFAKAVGTVDARARIKKYTLVGEMRLDTRGIQQTFGYKVYRELPDKYAEISISPVAGEIRTIHEGKVMHVKSAFGFDQKSPVYESMTIDLDYLVPIDRLTESTAEGDLSYLGIFERDGMKLHTIESKGKHGVSVAYSFDVKTGMLAGIATAYSTAYYSDFRKVGELMLPFRIEAGRSMKFQFDEIHINTEIDASVFQQKEYCFDKPSL